MRPLIIPLLVLQACHAAAGEAGTSRAEPAQRQLAPYTHLLTRPHQSPLPRRDGSLAYRALLMSPEAVDEVWPSDEGWVVAGVAVSHVPDEVLRLTVDQGARSDSAEPRFFEVPATGSQTHLVFAARDVQPDGPELLVYHGDGQALVLLGRVAIAPASRPPDDLERAIQYDSFPWGYLSDVQDTQLARWGWTGPEVSLLSWTEEGKGTVSFSTIGGGARDPENLLRDTPYPGWKVFLAPRTVPSLFSRHPSSVASPADR